MYFTIATSVQLLSFGDAGYADELLWGAVRTLQIAILSYMFGIGLGLCGAAGKLSGRLWLRRFVDGYTTLFRAIPELVLILLLYYAGTVGINQFFARFGLQTIEVNGLVAAVVVLGVVQGAYSTEVLRAAIQAVPTGQIEAAKACGMPPLLRFRRIILPAMMPYAISGLANLWLNATKQSALISVVGFTELFSVTKQAAGMSKQYFMFYSIAALAYLSIALVSNRAFGWLERQVRRGQPNLA